MLARSNSTVASASNRPLEFLHFWPCRPSHNPLPQGAGHPSSVAGHRKPQRGGLTQPRPSARLLAWAEVARPFEPRFRRPQRQHPSVSREDMGEDQRKRRGLLQNDVSESAVGTVTAENFVI